MRMPYVNTKLLFMSFALTILTSCSHDEGTSAGVSERGFFEYSIDGGSLQRLEITETTNSDIDSFYSTADNETVFSVPLEWDGATYLKVFSFRYAGAGTGAQSVTQASYWLNDGSNTTYSHLPGTASSATLEITAYGEFAQPIKGSFNFTLCTDTATCSMSMTIAGSFSVLRNVDR
jgi:hypothetical protein